jgi:hypothetical protein
MVKNRGNEYTLEQGLSDEPVVVGVEHDDPVSARIARLEAVQLLILAHLDPSGTSVSLKVREESEVT